MKSIRYIITALIVGLLTCSPIWMVEAAPLPTSHSAHVRHVHHIQHLHHTGQLPVWCWPDDFGACGRIG